jgi:hypothetical protein
MNPTRGERGVPEQTRDKKINRKKKNARGIVAKDASLAPIVFLLAGGPKSG